jgi:hypothetical protein
MNASVEGAETAFQKGCGVSTLRKGGKTAVHLTEAQAQL